MARMRLESRGRGMGGFSSNEREGMGGGEVR